MKIPTVCTVRVVIEGGNDWKPLYFTKETLMWEMKKAEWRNSRRPQTAEGVTKKKKLDSANVQHQGRHSHL